MFSFDQDDWFDIRHNIEWVLNERIKKATMVAKCGVCNMPLEGTFVNNGEIDLVFDVDPCPCLGKGWESEEQKEAAFAKMVEGKTYLLKYVENEKGEITKCQMKRKDQQ